MWSYVHFIKLYFISHHCTVNTIHFPPKVMFCMVEDKNLQDSSVLSHRFRNSTVEGGSFKHIWLTEKLDSQLKFYCDGA